MGVITHGIIRKNHKTCTALGKSRVSDNMTILTAAIVSKKNLDKTNHLNF